MVYNVNRTTDVTDYMGKNCTQVVFSDESRFNVNNAKERCEDYRRLHERYERE